MTGRRNLLMALLAGVFVLVSTGARAESCTISTSAVAFGTYDPLSPAPLDTTSTIQVTCTSNTPPKVTYDVKLDTGQSGSYNPRAMAGGPSQLNYNLYTNSSRTNIWGDGTGGTNFISANYNLTPPGSTQTDSYTAYGRIFAGQTVSVGSYLDTITATVTF